MIGNRAALPDELVKALSGNRAIPLRVGIQLQVPRVKAEGNLARRAVQDCLFFADRSGAAQAPFILLERMGRFIPRGDVFSCRR
jgi:hypothetical protein